MPTRTKNPKRPAAMQPDACRRVRTGLGLTQTEFGQQLGVHKATVARWEAGVLNIGQPMAMAIQALHQRGVVPVEERA